jgi:5-methylcytosine-specific restriction enzyme subunit McrC
MAIPIENIYYLLSYAWNKLDEKNRIAISAEDCTDLLDLLAKVLINSTRILLKRGIDRNYVDVTNEFTGVKGKLELSQTVKSQLLLKQKTICSFDEFSSNILSNQILVTTLFRLIKTRNLDQTLKGEIKNLLWQFGEVEQVILNQRVFGDIRIHRNNKFYDFILNVCRLIFENSLISEQTGDFTFTDFVRDERKMSSLFESFLRNFYTIEQTKYKVKRENIYWQFSAQNQQHLDFLPLMQTDITLENNKSKIIIDAKFYKETFKSNRGKVKINSGNLFQLFSYLVSQQSKNVQSQYATGLLIYPTIAVEYDLAYKFENHHIFIKTINLNQNWKFIYQRLLEIIRDID